MAKDKLVDKVIVFSAGWDYSAANKIAQWYYKASATPSERWYSTYNQAEPNASWLAETYEAMPIPTEHVYTLNKEVRGGRRAHVEGIKNPAYQAKWIEMLGREN